MIVDGAYKIARLVTRGQIDTYEAESMDDGQAVLVHLVSAEGQAQRRAELFQRVKKHLDHLAKQGAPRLLTTGEFQQTPYVVTANTPEFRTLNEILAAQPAQMDEDTWSTREPSSGSVGTFTALFGDEQEGSAESGSAKDDAWGSVSAPAEPPADDGWQTAQASTPPPTPAPNPFAQEPAPATPPPSESTGRMTDTAPRVPEPYPGETGISKMATTRPELAQLRIVNRETAQPGLSGKARRPVQPEDMDRAHQPERYKEPYRRQNSGVAAVVAPPPEAPAPAAPAEGQKWDEMFGPAPDSAPAPPAEEPAAVGESTQIMDGPPKLPASAELPPKEPTPSAPVGTITQWMFGDDDGSAPAAQEEPDAATESWLGRAPGEPPQPSAPAPTPPTPPAPAAPPAPEPTEAELEPTIAEPAAPKATGDFTMHFGDVSMAEQAEAKAEEPAAPPPPAPAATPAPPPSATGDFTMHFGKAQGEDAPPSAEPAPPPPPANKPAAGDFTMQFGAVQESAPAANPPASEPPVSGSKHDGTFTELFRSDDKYYEDPNEIAKKNESFLKEEEVHPFEKPEPSRDAAPKGGDFTQLFSSDQHGTPPAQEPVDEHPFSDKPAEMFASESNAAPPVSSEVQPILQDDAPKDAGSFTQLFKPRDEGPGLAERPDASLPSGGGSSAPPAADQAEGVSTSLFSASDVPSASGASAPPSAGAVNAPPSAPTPNVPSGGGPSGPSPGIPGGAPAGAGPIGIPGGPRIVPEAATPVAAGGGAAPTLEAPPTPAREGYQKPEIGGQAPQSKKWILWAVLGVLALVVVGLIFVAIAIFMSSSAPEEGDTAGTEQTSGETADASGGGPNIDKANLGIAGGNIHRPSVTSGTVTRSGIQRPTLNAPSVSRPTMTTSGPRVYGPRVQDPTLNTGGMDTSGNMTAGRLSGGAVRGPGVSGIPGGNSFEASAPQGGQPAEQQPAESQNTDVLLFAVIGGAILLLIGIGVVAFFLFKK